MSASSPLCGVQRFLPHYKAHTEPGFACKDTALLPVKGRGKVSATTSSPPSQGHTQPGMQGQSSAASSAGRCSSTNAS